MIDTHAHLNNEKLFENIDMLQKEALNNKVEKIVNIGTNIKTSEEVVKLSKQYANNYATVGFHPHFAKSYNKKREKEIEKLVKENNKIVAIGEVGLDFHYNFSSKRTQKRVFKAQIKLANKLKLPLVIHTREATKETLSVLENNKKLLKNGGIIHCFGEGNEIAERYVKLGFMLGIGGLITFKNAQNVKDAVQKIGLDNIVLETDCPYLAPVPFRGKLNQPAYLKYICAYIANFLNLTQKEVDEITTKNAKKVYKI